MELNGSRQRNDDELYRQASVYLRVTRVVGVTNPCGRVALVVKLSIYRDLRDQLITHFKDHLYEMQMLEISRCEGRHLERAQHKVFCWEVSPVPMCFRGWVRDGSCVLGCDNRLEPLVSTKAFALSVLGAQRKYGFTLERLGAFAFTCRVTHR